MKEKLVVKEQFSPYWKMASYLSTIIAILFFIIFLLSSDPLWEGIFRFIAFIGFIGAVFSYLRLREGKKDVVISFPGNQLLISYHKKDEMLKEEIFEQQTIKEIYKNEYQPLSGLPFRDKGYKFFITFTDTEKKLPLFEYSGRNLHFSKQAAGEIDEFMNKKL